ncbi:actin-related protein 7, partial [Tanacetum coccineum]
IMNDDGSIPDSSSLLANNVDPVVRGFVKDWDDMGDLLHHVLYNGLGWEIGNEGQILFADPLLTPKSPMNTCMIMCLKLNDAFACCCIQENLE